MLLNLRRNRPAVLRNGSANLGSIPYASLIFERDLHFVAVLSIE
jgi:hypothetical protein